MVEGTALEMRRPGNWTEGSNPSLSVSYCIIIVMEKMPEGNEPAKKVPKYEVDLSAAWDTESEAEILVNELKRLEIYKQGLRFCGFNADDIKKPRDIIYCCGEEELKVGSGGEGQNALDYAHEHENPVIAVYDGEKLESTGDGNDYAYYHSDEALIAYLVPKRRG